MSSSEIADNKWELEASKPPITTAGAMAQIAIIGAFTLVFGWILAFSVLGIVSPKKKTMADKYGEMNAEGGAAAPAEAPAAE
ncbi:MAG: hypothetical protein H6713_20140 [Myxococcales bacterium]|nr:hypothetical protein [Myxococcales bacterium]MCB9752272.1 hypothetical protein [Myxococcales bacterium]